MQVGSGSEHSLVTQINLYKSGDKTTDIMASK